MAEETQTKEVHYHNDSRAPRGNPVSMILMLVVVILIVFLVLFFFTGFGNFLSGGAGGGISVPEQVDVNVNTPQGEGGGQ